MNHKRKVTRIRIMKVSGVLIGSFPAWIAITHGYNVLAWILVAVGSALWVAGVLLSWSK